MRVLREYERAVVFRLGRVMAQKGPGLVLLIPAVDRMVRVSLRTGDPVVVERVQGLTLSVRRAEEWELEL